MNSNGESFKNNLERIMNSGKVFGVGTGAKPIVNNKPSNTKLEESKKNGMNIII
jgi:hypothetical protein